MVSRLPRASLPPLPKDRYSVAVGFPRDEIQISSNDNGNKHWHDRMILLTSEVVRVLERETFRASDFWEGYKLYCFARYSDCRRSEVRFVASKMGRVFGQLQNEENVKWGSICDRKVREMWAMMEEYADLCHNEDWKNLRALMEEFDDVKKLSMSKKGCLLLQVLEDDDNVNEELQNQFQRIEFRGTNIFEEIRNRLDVVSSNLERLIDSSSNKPKECRKRRRESISTIPFVHKKMTTTK